MIGEVFWLLVSEEVAAEGNRVEADQVGILGQQVGPRLVVYFVSGVYDASWDWSWYAVKTCVLNVELKLKVLTPGLYSIPRQGELQWIGEEVLVQVLCVEPHGGGNGVGRPVDHDVVQKLVERELLGQESVVGVSSTGAVRPRRELLQDVGG